MKDIDLGSLFTLIVLYHDKPNSGVPRPKNPGVVRGPDGNNYVLSLVEPFTGEITVKEK